MICITDRNACPNDFLERIQRIAAARPDAIILREKDLSVSNYWLLARQCRDICAKEGTELVLHSHWDIARTLGVPSLHMTFPAFDEQPDAFGDFAQLGVSVHSVSEALMAERNGATRLIAGHIFATESKKGAPPRGLSFLAEICNAVSIPVFAIGGVKPERMGEIIHAGAAGGCALSSFMTTNDPAALVARFKDATPPLSKKWAPRSPSE